MSRVHIFYEAHRNGSKITDVPSPRETRIVYEDFLRVAELFFLVFLPKMSFIPPPPPNPGEFLKPNSNFKIIPSVDYFVIINIGLGQ